MRSFDTALLGRRTNADKRRAVETLLRDEEWKKWSDREIARRCGVDNSFASRVRESLLPNNSDRTYRTKHGTVTTMKRVRGSHWKRYQ